MKTLLLLFLFISHWSSFGQHYTFFDIARRGSVDEANIWILNQPSAVNDTNAYGFSPLILACYSNNLPMVEFLIENKATIDYVSSEGTALMAATVKGNEDIVAFLLKRGAQVDLTNESGVTALMYAVQFKNVPIIKMLLDNHANKQIVDAQGRTAFEYAVFTKNDDIINLLKNK